MCCIAINLRISKEALIESLAEQATFCHSCFIAPLQKICAIFAAGRSN